MDLGPVVRQCDLFALDLERLEGLLAFGDVAEPKVRLALVAVANHGEPALELAATIWRPELIG
jgi:hypothetical protein